MDLKMKKYAALCTAVHDGDSIKVQFENIAKWVRLYAVDTCEVISNYVTETQPMGVEAGNIVRKTVKRQEVEVTELGIDIYDRPLVLASLKGKDMGEYLLESGLAWYVPLKKGEKNLLPIGVRKNYFAAFQMAKRQKLGIWATKSSIHPSVWRATHRRILSSAMGESQLIEGFDFGDYPE
jgi:endonuclease YncB( thermonuclease family)